MSQFRKAVGLGDMKQKVVWLRPRKPCPECEGGLMVDTIGGAVTGWEVKIWQSLAKHVYSAGGSAEIFKAG